MSTAASRGALPRPRPARAGHDRAASASPRAALGRRGARHRRLPTLTARGAVVLVVGAATATAGVVLDQRDLLRVAALLLVLVLAGVLLALWVRPRLVVERTVTPGRVPVGGTASVRLDLRSAGGRGGVLLAEDAVPQALGARPRFVLDGLPAGGSAAVRYAVHGHARGRHEVGPLRLDVLDPFGLVRVPRDERREPAATSTLLVTPRVTPLSPLRAPGRRPAAHGGATAAGAGGEDDAVPREYRSGDDRRRVHWRSTARRGELMVRRDEEPHLPSATVLLDRRAASYGPPGSQAADLAFERAVAATASVCARLERDGWLVRLALGDAAGEVEEAGMEQHLVRLALARRADPPGERGVPRDEDGALERAVRPARARSSDDVLVAVVGAATVPAGGSDAPAGNRATALLSGVRARHRVALVVHGPGDGEAAARTVAEPLARRGWGTALLGPDDDLPATWRVAAGVPAARPGAPVGASR